MSESRPVVLSISGHDPSGGAGIQADIETIAALHCYPCTVVTALTLQDTDNVKKVFPQPSGQIREQLGLLFNDFDIRCIKIGLLGSLETVRVLHSVLKDNTGIPVVLDPVLSAGGGFDFSHQELVRAISAELIPLATVMTPNRAEARRLSPARFTLEKCGNYLNSLGCEHILITGADASTPQVVNALYRTGEEVRLFHWERLAGAFHGSGCTLASAIAALLARGFEPLPAVSEAQKFTWQALQAGFKPGKGQSIPDRLVQLRTG
ncbi:MAG: hydroxymethylpyrimidine/phosphomethylpyrimidine kinase [Methylococcaceae bacterium]|nr:hydroxymethylpyrimidine/phosphomethylpyrimidine kinase [Methylococcaceae bacterium]